LTGHNGQVSAVAFNPVSNELLSASIDTTARFWDLSRGEAISNRIPDHDVGASTASSVAFSPAADELAVIDGDDGSVRLLGASGSLRAAQPNPALEVRGVAFLPDGTLVTVGPDDAVRFRDPRTGHELRDPLRAGRLGFLSAPTISKDGTKLAAVGPDAVWLWDLHTGDVVGQPLVGNLSWTLNIALSPDGSLLATQRYLGNVQLWDTASRLPVGDPLPGVMVKAIAFSPSANVLAEATLNTVRVWDITDGEPTNERVLSHPSDVSTVAFSPDGSMIVTGTSGTELGDAELRLWDSGSGRALGEPLTSSSGPFEALAFDRTGSQLATAASVLPDDPGIGGVRLWRPVWNAADACRLAARYVTRAQVERLAPPGRKLEACDY
jgi:WD40 repeat protein